MSTIEPIKTGLCLRVVEGSHQEPIHPLTRSVISVGRTTAETPYSSSYITFPEATLSRLHIVLTWEPGASAYMVHHRSQTNPTLLNGKPISRSELLKPGDFLSLGRLVLLLETCQADQVSPVSKQSDQLVLNVQNRVDSKSRVYSIPVQKSRLTLAFSTGRQTAAIAAEETGDLAQLVALPAEQDQELSFEFDPDTPCATVEAPFQGNPTIRRTVLPSGTLEVPLRVGTPLPMTAVDVVRHQDYQIWLSQGDGTSPPSGTLDRSSASPPPGSASVERVGGVLHFLNGAWKGATLTTPSHGSQAFDLGPRSKSFHHAVPLANTPTCRLTIQDGEAQIRVNELSDDQFVDINGNLLFTGESCKVFSGSSLLLGDSEFFWENPELHQRYTRFQIAAPDGTHEISKAEVKLGTAAHCEVRFKIPALAPVVGILKYDSSGFTYRHQNIAFPARVDGLETSAGLEAKVQSGSSLELAPGVTVQLEEPDLRSC
jgi:pSer/pThr/pTyr-binding forkhead associated (FHA) protein